LFDEGIAVQQPLTVFFMLALLSASQSATADIYKCKQPDGETIYQQTPCAGGEQKVLDDRQARVREAEEQKRKALLRTASHPGASSNLK